MKLPRLEQDIPASVVRINQRSQRKKLGAQLRGCGDGNYLVGKSQLYNDKFRCNIYLDITNTLILWVGKGNKNKGGGKNELL